jgi:hypothetical protein
MHWKFTDVRLRCNLQRRVGIVAVGIENAGRLTPPEIEAAILELGGESLKTNASAVRAHLGRGSNQTIQKVLDAMKAKLREASLLSEADELPAMPMEEMRAVWRAAATASLKVSYERLAKLQLERDQALDRLADTTDALDAANVQMDLLQEAAVLSSKEALLLAEQSEKLQENLKTDAALASEKFSSEKEHLQEVINALRSDLLNVKNALELERANFAIERGTLDRVVEQQLARNVQLTEFLNRVSPQHGGPLSV